MMEGRIEEILRKVLPDIHNRRGKLSLVNRAAPSCRIIAYYWDGLIRLALIGLEIIPVSCRSCGLNALRVLFPRIFCLHGVSHYH